MHLPGSGMLATNGIATQSQYPSQLIPMAWGTRLFLVQSDSLFWSQCFPLLFCCSQWYFAACAYDLGRDNQGSIRYELLVGRYRLLKDTFLRLISSHSPEQRQHHTCSSAGDLVEGWRRHSTTHRDVDTGRAVKISSKPQLL